MELVTTYETALPPHLRGAVITVGTFDGVHRGHLDVLTRLVARARAVGRPSLLVTFEPHPLEVLNPDAAPLLLTTRDEKLAVLAATGLGYVVILPFTVGFAALSAEQFVDQVLLQRFGMAELLIGHDHGFGRGREGDIETLRLLGAERAFHVEVVSPVESSSGEAVSSTRIRRSLLAGALAEAADDLGRAYSISGRVVAGDARGRLLGFPTINVRPESPRKLLPLAGVYAVHVSTPRGPFGGMMNLGGRPTFGDDRHAIEAHLFDAAGDFYGESVDVGLVARLRDTRRFDGAAALMAQLGEDERAARRALTALVVPGTLSGSTPAPPSTP
jgi:riboflavin kinase/FMN adenylyltransferase